jgi:hypothetical protein
MAGALLCLMVGSFLLYVYVHGIAGDNAIDWAIRDVIGWWNSLSAGLTS